MLFTIEDNTSIKKEVKGFVSKIESTRLSFASFLPSSSLSIKETFYQIKGECIEIMGKFQGVFAIEFERQKKIIENMVMEKDRINPVIFNIDKQLGDLDCYITCMMVAIDKVGKVVNTLGCPVECESKSDDCEEQQDVEEQEKMKKAVEELHTQLIDFKRAMDEYREKMDHLFPK